MISCLITIITLWWTTPGAIAGALSQRIEQFPNWHSQPQLDRSEGELAYPEWFRGQWRATSTLLNQTAPLAPALITPGFESNRKYLDQPISFIVKFTIGAIQQQPQVSLLNLTFQTSTKPSVIIPDRAFNGLNIATAYLGKDYVKSVKVDPNNPTKQITQLAHQSQLVSIVTKFGSEILNPNHFIATELSQQIFRKSPQIYFNTVETTSDYQFSPTPTPKITATQITAIYLSPQDPDYFRAGDRPVALYEYRLELVPES